MGMTTTSTQRWVLGLSALASFMVVLDMLVVVTALPTIQRDLHASLEALEWTVNAYTLSFAVLLMSAAALGDRYGRRRMFTFGVALFGGASAGCALAPTAAVLVAARAVQGAGAAFVMPLALGLLAGAFAPRERPRALGIFAAAAGSAVALGPPFGGAVVQGISWPWIFWLNVPLAAVLITIARARADEQHGPRAALDGRGLLLVTAAAFSLVWGLVRGNAAGWGSVEVLAALVAGAAFAAAFVSSSCACASRCCPWRCSAGARSRPATQRCSSYGGRASAASSSWPSSSRTGSATARSAQGRD
jgi:MFS family permease